MTAPEDDLAQPAGAGTRYDIIRLKSLGRAFGCE